MTRARAVRELNGPGKRKTTFTTSPSRPNRMVKAALRQAQEPPQPPVQQQADPGGDQHADEERPRALDA
jgi:hypothetical protein